MCVCLLCVFFEKGRAPENGNAVSPIAWLNQKEKSNKDGNKEVFDVIHRCSQNISYSEKLKIIMYTCSKNKEILEP